MALSSDKSNSSMMAVLGEDRARVMVLGEARMLTTAILKLHHAHHSFNYYGGGGRSSGRSGGLKESQSVPSRLAAAAASENEEDEDDFLDSTLVVGADPSSPTASPIDPILANLIRLKGKLRKGPRTLNVLTDRTFLQPFCEIIKNKEVSGPITGMALQSMMKFIDYGLISRTEHLGSVLRLCDATTKARFVGTDTAHDEVVLFRILSVLKELVVREYRTPTNEQIIDIMQGCFRIAFETRLSELLRDSAEQALIEMCRSLFSRVHLFSNELAAPMTNHIKLGGMKMDRNRTSKLQRSQSESKFDKTSSSASTSGSLNAPSPPVPSSSASDSGAVLVNAQGVKFAENVPSPTNEQAPPLDVPQQPQAPKKSQEPHGIACIYEMMHYLTTITNPYETSNNAHMINLGINLLIVAFESAVESIGQKPALMTIVKNELCFNMTMLLNIEQPLTTFASTLRLAFLIFKSLRNQLKYQMESFFVKMMEIITTANAKLEYRENALEYLIGYFREITYLPHELFYNYDCDPTASNLLETLLQLFSKNCFNSSVNSPQGPVTSSQLSSQNSVFTPIQLLSLDALLSSLKSMHKGQLCTNLSLTIPAPTPQQQSQQQSQKLDNITERSPEKQVSPKKKSKRHRKQDSVTSQHVDVGLSSTEHVVLQMPSEDEELSDDDEETLSGQASPDHNPDDTTKQQLSLQHHIKYPKSQDEIEQLKHRKHLIWQAGDQFNLKPIKGYEFLRQHGLVSNDYEFAQFLYENARLDKKILGEYLANKNNEAVLTAFISLFPFKGVRIDEALRMLLESFRLPGEAPLIYHIIDHFAQFWHDENDEPFANKDAALTLSYGIIMLNVDQHNTNAKKQSVPMTADQFKANLRGVNGDADFDPQLLKEIYTTIKNNEIVMPAEQQGVVRERYLWKCLMRAADSEYGVYWKVADHDLLAQPAQSPSSPPTGDMAALSLESKTDQENGSADASDANKIVEEYELPLILLNEQIFAVMWGPTIAALTFIFDKCNVQYNASLTNRILNNGFKSCALLCATYGHLDSLIISLCKFSVNSTDISNAVISYKSQLAAQCLFEITRDYANEMRESWTNVVALILSWFQAKLLDEMLEIDDFALNQKLKIKRRINLKQTQKQKDEGGFMSSLYSYFASGPESQTSSVSDQNADGDKVSNDGEQPSNGQQLPNDVQELINCCQPLTFIEESRFLHIDSLLELIKALVNVHLELEDEDAEDIEVFKFEILLQILLLNRDRVSVLWPHVSGYLLNTINMSSSSEFMIERVVSGMFRITVRFAARQDLWCPLLQTIAMLAADARRSIRTCTLTFLQRTLLLHELRILTATQWESCFNNILFPMLTKLLEPMNEMDPMGIDETRMRAINLLCKVYLQNLTMLRTLPTFTALWLTILDFMDKYMKAETQTDLVKEAIPESLKNVLLVMDTAGCLNTTLSALTWDRISHFLPNLREELAPPEPPGPHLPPPPLSSSLPTALPTSLPASLPSSLPTSPPSSHLQSPVHSPPQIPSPPMARSPIGSQLTSPVHSPVHAPGVAVPRQSPPDSHHSTPAVSEHASPVRQKITTT